MAGTINDPGKAISLSEATITSVRNPRVQAAAQLRERRERARRGRILIDGAREIRRALEANVKLLEAFYCLPEAADDDARQVLASLEAVGVAVIPVAPHVFARVAYGERAAGLVAVAETPRATLDALRLPENPLVAVVEASEKPGNLGAVLRSADAAGLSAVIAADSVTDLFNPNTIRASLGTVFTLPVAAASAEETLAYLRRQRLQIIAARVDAASDYTDVDYTRPTAIVLGSEAVGLTDRWRSADVTAVRLPMRGAADSLNLSATAAVLFYEALRQRR